MERMTVKRKDGRWAIENNDNAKPMEQMSKLSAALDRLAAYEDTGLEPEEVQCMVENAESRLLLYFEKQYGIGAGRMMELAQADREGRVKILPEAEKGTCGDCTHFKRTPGARSGTCSVREWYTDCYGHIDRHRGQFTPSQSRRACKQYVAREKADHDD